MPNPPQHKHVFLDHSIVGQSELTNFKLRKDRQYAFCRICGALYQSRLATDTDDLNYTTDWAIPYAVEIETREWQMAHNKTHPEHVHKSFVASGRFLSPEATVKLAPYGIAPVSDMIMDDEVAQAALEAPRAPSDSPVGSW